MTDSAKAKRKIFNFSLLRRVFHFAAPYKNKFYGSLVLALLLAAFAPLRPLLIQLTINKTEIPKLVTTLIAKNIGIIALQPRHSLEEYFLSLTNTEAHVESVTN